MPNTPDRTIAAHGFDPSGFCMTLAANIDNDKLSDADFREFVRNSVPSLETQREIRAARARDRR